MRTMLVVVLVFALFTACGQDESKAEKKIQLEPFDFSFKTYAELLDKYVIGKNVDYNSLRKDSAILNNIVDVFETADLSGASDNKKIAFYINAYNAITLKSIIDEYPVKSIRDIDGVWDEKKWLVAGKNLTLNEIEHELLRKDFDEPRIHVAVNCASIGCPPLRSEPYLPSTLNSQLDDAARNFATDPLYNRLDPVQNLAQISKIFEWYGEDFIPQYHNDSHFGSLSEKKNAALHFLIRYFPENEQDEMLAVEYGVSYLEYDWALNDIEE